MAVVFNPDGLTTPTIAFGHVPLGVSKVAILLGTCTNNQEYFIDGSPNPLPLVTGPQAAQFTYQDNGGPYGHYTLSRVAQSSGSITYTPTTIGAATATWGTSSGGPFAGLYIATIGSSQGFVGPFPFNFTLTGTGGTSPVSGGEAPSLLQSFRQLLVPSQGTTGKVLSIYDSLSFDDALDGASYTFKAEDILADRVPTVRRVVITYIDLGVARLDVRLTGVNDAGVAQIATTTVTIGTVAATGNLLTAYADLSLTSYRPQLTLIRGIAVGPIAISTVLLTGTIEKQVTL